MAEGKLLPSLFFEIFLPFFLCEEDENNTIVIFFLYFFFLQIGQ